MAVPAGLALCVSGSNLHCAGIVGITDVPGGDGGALPGFDSGFDGSRPHLDGSPPGTDGGHPGTDGSQPGTDSSQPRSDGGGSPLTFAPSNVGGMSFSAAGLGPLTLNGGDNCAVFTDYPSQPIISCSAPLNPSMEVFGVNMPGGAGEAIIYVFTDVSIGAGSILDIQGPLPVIIVALGSVDIAGAIDASADQFGSVGAVGIPGARLTGPGIGGFNAQMGPQGGGGGSFCGLGGQGAIGTTGTVQSESMPGASYGTANLIPLWGGSAGGGASTQTGSVTANGYGGGAIQISAAGQITVESGGYISVNGSGGVASNEAGEGGGSGGGILLEAPTVTVEGVLEANGGGGSDWNGDGASPPTDGGVANEPGGYGGNGSAATSVTGTNGAPGSGGYGGGGGGAGWIRINANTARVTGTVSPSMGSMCASKGPLP